MSTSIFNQMFLIFDPLNIIQICCWLIAGVVSLYFSVGNARLWTSISFGFFLLMIGQSYLINPLVKYHLVIAMHHVCSVLSIMLISHGIFEYYLFCRTLEISGKKQTVYIATAGILIFFLCFLLVNPNPSPNAIRNYQIIANAIWVILCIANIELCRKIYLSLRNSSIGKGFLGFAVAFALIMFWKGAFLYQQIYQWDRLGQDIYYISGQYLDIDDYADIVKFTYHIISYTGILASMTVVGTHLYFLRQLKSSGGES
jgi:hypothetical protein